MVRCHLIFSVYPMDLVKQRQLLISQYDYCYRTAVHVLDEESPLLKKKVRDKIKENGGWDSKDFTNEALRKSLNFYEIVVSINGVSRQTVSHVYAQKIYDRSDIFVGFQFVNILEKKGGPVKVISEYLDHIIKQDERKKEKKDGSGF
jgi:hypothetical protein